MKFFEKSLIFFSCIGLSYFSIEAKSISVLFENSTSENYSLEALVSNPLPYCQRIIVENQGTKAVHGCLPTSNGEEYLSLDHLAQLLAKEKQPLLSLFKLWQKVLPCDQSQKAEWSNSSALDYLNHIGSCPISEYQKQFIQLCHQLGIDTRQANIKGKTVYDFNCQGDEWSLLDVISGQFYLGWDNKTLISSEAMMDDPLLVLRTKPLYSSDQMDFAKAWQNFAQLELIDPSIINDEITFQPEISSEKRGFDLYPNEKLVYLLSKDELNPCQARVEQILDWQARHAEANGSYHSPFPIREIYNGTTTQLYLKDQQVTLQPDEGITFNDQRVFALDIQMDVGCSGTIKVVSNCPWRLFPSIHSGKNTIHLGTNKNPGSIKWTFEVDEELENKEQSLITILNQTNHFEHTAPHILLNNIQTNPASEIWWQISPDAEFKTIPSNLEQVEPFVSEINFLPITQTFFNSDDTYYFRVKGCRNGVWGNWSDSFAFTVKKPDQVNLIEFDQEDPDTYVLDWSREAELSETAIEYLVFGSNAYDFVPSIYSATQINEIIDGKVILEERNDNLIAITTETKFKVDGSLAYYRIIARKNGLLSLPSPIIHIYGNELIQPRTVLQIVEIDGDKFIAKRILFPPSYRWTETALPRLGVQNRLYENSLLKLKAMILKAKEPFGSFNLDLLASTDLLSESGYVRPSHVSTELWEKMRPYFLPENHPWKKKIDRIFTKSRASQNTDTIKRAGFKGRITGVRRIFAGIHPECVECFFKIYLDSEHTKYIEWQKWIDRITGKNLVKECIKKYGFEKWFSTPDKWVYPLPEKPECSKSSKYNPKNFILCCSNQRPYDHRENEKMWKSKLSKQHLEALYILIDEPGMWDSVFAFNIPFSKVDNRMCFVDTEYFHKWPIRFEKLNKYFSKEAVKYWEYLIKHNGPKGYKSPHPVY